jgi:hypothetical protein
MFKRVILLNVVLLALVAGGVIRLRQDARAFSIEHRVDRVQPASDRPLPKAVAAAATQAGQEWPEIAARNPFSFDRNDVTLVITPPAAQQPQKPKPILFGVMTLGTDRLAMLGPGDAGNRASRPVRVGEVFEGWKLVEIQSRSVTMQWENIKETVIMNDPTVQVARLTEKTGGANPGATPVLNLSPVSAPVATPAQTQPVPTDPPPPVSPTGKKQILVRTPFGNKWIDDPNQ